MARVVIRPKARRELTQIIIYLMENAGPNVALRFRHAVTETFEELTRTPEIGAPRKVRRSEFAGIRMWRVKDFPTYLIFYFPRKDSVAIERVIHAKLDYQRIFGK